MKKLAFLFIILFLSACESLPKTTHENKSISYTPIPITKGIAFDKFNSMYGVSLKNENHKDLEYLSGDFTCDGAVDYVVSANHLTHFQGLKFEIIFVTGHRGIAKYSAHPMEYGLPNSGVKAKYTMRLYGNGSVKPIVKELKKFEVDGKSSSELMCKTGVYIQQPDKPGYLLYFNIQKLILGIK
jgi:hypothetical protein